MSAEQIFEKALETAGIYDASEVEQLPALTYLESHGGDNYYIVFLFGDEHSKKFYRVTLPQSLQGDGFSESFRLKNIAEMRLDKLGCIIKLADGKKIELKNNPLEGSDAFMQSARGLETLWDDVAG